MPRVQCEFVSGGKLYTYEAGNLDLKIGDKVRIPDNLFGESQIVTVVKLSSDYTGPAKQILHTLPRKKDANRIRNK